MKQENGRYAAGFLFAVATFVVMAIWLCTQYTPQRLWELFCSVRLRWLAGAAGLMVSTGCWNRLSCIWRSNVFLRSRRPATPFEQR